jgi:GNAT superfamily N-acetyltransferase
MDFIEITTPESRELIQFHNLLVDAFPDSHEREDLDILRENLRSGSWVSEDELCKYHLIVARYGDQVVGGTSFYFYSYKNVALGMGSYLAVGKSLQGNGLGSKLVAMRDGALWNDAKKSNSHLKGLIIQVNDPALMSPEELKRDSMDPHERESFWKHKGYKKIGFDFVQPSIRAGEPPVEYLSLYMYPYCSEWENLKQIPNRDLREIIHCFIRCTGTIGPKESDPAYIRMSLNLGEQAYFLIC